jgi:putative restriction endonuclease
MRNLAIIHRAELEERNYVRKADPRQKYWFDFAANKMADYQQQFGDSFALIIVGDEDVPNDYYVIPFPEVAHVFATEFLSVDQDGTRRRWVGSVENDRLKITRFPDRINIKQCKGARFEEIQPRVEQSLNISFEGRTRDVIVPLRIGQALFRKRVMDNFDYACALSGISEPELLVASHIIPWRTRIDTRLDPRNGILLYSAYDALFDKGFISFDDDFRVLITPLVNGCSKELGAILSSLTGLQLRRAVLHTLSPEFLKWHRENRFITA